MGYSANSSKGNSTKRNPNAQKRVKKTEYAIQLNEKQKIKFIYGLLEKQLPDVLREGVSSNGITGEVLLRLSSAVWTTLSSVSALRLPAVLPARWSPMAITLSTASGSTSLPTW